MRAHVAALASAVGLGIASWSAAAIGAPFELAWSAPSGCPSRERIVDATRARLGEGPSDAPPELFVRGTVAAGETGGFVVRLAMTDASGAALGEREVRVEQESCSEIEAPTSLVLAMMIAVADPGSEPHEQATGAPPPAPPPKPVPKPAPAVAPVAAAPAPPRSSRRVLLGAAGVGSTGILPSAGLGFGIRAAYSPGAGVSLGLETAFETTRSVHVAGGEVGFQLFSAAARLGMSVLGTETLEVIPTIGARGALLRTSPSGFSAVHHDVRPTMLAGPGILVRVKLASHLFAEVLPEVEAVLVRDRFRIRDGEKLYHIHRPSFFEGRLWIGIGYELR